ncbi:MAG: hypothetical protein ACRDWG_09385 [Actinomycetes bacterium]|jgi:NAD(P)-dependent dehydrogenase (short-subunit alcohol dehydrogenase family)|nr:hypothetical protein [Actinomycetes bacterium]
MKILITAPQSEAGAAAADLLGAAGHSVAFCRPDDGSALCAGLGTGPLCPLTTGDIDVVVDARTNAAAMSPRELGVLCALNHGTPLVVAGPVPDQGHPWQDADVLCAADDVVAGCKVAISPIGPSSLRSVRSAATRVLRQHGAGDELTLTIRTRNGHIDIFIAPDRPLSPQVREAIRIVVRAALAPYTDEWSYAQVYFSR